VRRVIWAPLVLLVRQVRWGTLALPALPALPALLAHKVIRGLGRRDLPARLVRRAILALLEQILP
jgi:hypothetical protein